ncbi:hypothetical protein AY488_05945 [Corynebacterium belfantii]|nr:hypothetical protein AY473_00505 [Corynebacterium diphtheriae bv. mitis]OWN23371.1 hypothetical protein AY486_10520 [Corynebacterium diphtheriae bv. mitis]OWN41578.1 hypothetical protein AY488_05945 [Corynebacterium belfantii]
MSATHNRLGARSPKFTIDQVRAKIQALRFTSCDRCSSFALAGQPSTAHQPGFMLTPNVNALASQHAPHLPHPVDTVIFGNERHEYAPHEQRREDYGHLSPCALDWRYPHDVIKPPSRCVFNVWQMNKAEKQFQYSSMNRIIS